MTVAFSVHVVDGEGISVPDAYFDICEDEFQEIKRYILAKFRPITGRSHQLRVHAATPRDQGGIGAPIAGDSLYGDATSAPRLLLHATMLAFWDPTTHEWMRFENTAPF